MNYSKAELVKYRLERAKEIYDDAELLAKNERWKSAANRLYYACFHAISAYLAHLEEDAATHASLKSKFNALMVKTSKIDREEGKLFNRLFDIRLDADYEDFVKLEEAEIQPLVKKVKQLISDIEELLMAQ